ncbi:MAG: M23 family metallopeptidase [Fibrobacter sp.]|nr:M23 family metallopeptidase [Fibrobacter sp.]
MKKLEIHVFPGKTESPKHYRVSFLGAALFALAIVAGIAGYILFSPARIVDNVTSGDITSLHRQNKAIKKEIANIRASVDETIMKVEETRLLRDSTLRFGGLGFTLESMANDSERTIDHRKGLREIESSFSKLLEALQKDSVLSTKIPVLHPLKNGHAVKKRFDIVHDAFTDQDLPHKGIDYVAQDGDTVYASGAGIVSEVRKHRGFGLSMKIEHIKGVHTFYAHLGKNLVNNNAKVERGQPIAIIGESGTESSVGLHYEVHLKGNPINPENFFLTK